jgi:hypothetical protein
MRIHVVDKLIRYDLNPKPVVGEMHNWAFHGLARREGESDVLISKNLGDAPIAPLKITRSGTFIPKVFFPEMCWVVAAEIRGRLRNLRSVQFHTVVFERLVQLQVPKGDFTLDRWWAKHLNRKRLHPFDLLPDFQGSSDSIPKYYEMLVANYYAHPDLNGAIGESCQLEYEMSPPEVTERRHNFDVCPAALKEYKIFSTGANLLMDDDVFQVIDPHLDRDYFRVVETTLD